MLFASTWDGLVTGQCTVQDLTLRPQLGNPTNQVMQKIVMEKMFVAFWHPSIIASIILAP